MQLTRFDAARFLRDHWQQRPLVIRNPWTAWANPLDPDELAGLACEEGVDARLVQLADDGWKAEHGPLAETRFARLGAAPWTLLVQAVDHHVPDVAALLEAFRFVPNWRIDDVMVSYASDGGGVGPHFDQYDVFLIQGLGTRRWQVGARCDAATAELPHRDLRLLAEFHPIEEWVLEPGDILYVPPRFAHNGVALGDDCMTYSIGLRAPARSELIADWCDHVTASLSDDDRYEDPDLTAPDNPGEISSAALARLHAMIAEKLLDRDAFARWFGQHNSTRKYPDVDWSPPLPLTTGDVYETVAAGVPLRRNPASRFSFIRRDAGSLVLFVDGQCFDAAGAAAAFAQSICRHDEMQIDPALIEAPGVADLVVSLCNQGSAAFDDED